MLSLNSKIETLTQTVTNLSGSLDNARQAPPAAAAAPVPAPDTSAPVVDEISFDKLDPTEYAKYGDEFGKLATQMNAMAEALKAKLAAPVDAAPVANTGIEQRLANVEQRTFKTAEEKFFEQLYSLVPNYKDINANPALPGWLAEPDPISMYQRKEMLDFAFKNLNAPQAVAIIKQFAGSNNIVIPELSASTSSEGTNAAAAEQTTGNILDRTVDDPLAIAAMPGQTVGSGDGDSLNQPATVTAAEYNKAVQDYTAGRITKEAFQKTEATFQGQIGAK
jgi:hypothetical protein